VSTRAASARRSQAAPARRPAPAPGRPAPTRDAPPCTRQTPRPRRAARPPRARPRLGLLVVPLLAILLGGIVWVNAMKLSLTTRTTGVTERARAVQAENAELEAKLARQQARVMTLARARGMELSNADTLTFLQSVGGP
jgi:hypothetical protein